MRKSLGSSVLAAACLACAVLLAGCSLLGKDEARTRVENILSGLQKSDMSDEYQTAACMWYAGAAFIRDQGELQQAVDGFEKWIKAKEIAKPVRTFKVLRTEKNPTPPGGMFVTAQIDGRTYRMLVVKDQSVEWASEE